MLPAIILAVALAHPARAQTSTDRQREIETSLDDFAEAKTPAERATIIQYLQQLDHSQIAAALVDHIVNSRSGTEATTYNDLVETFEPDACFAAMDRLAKADQPAAKGKLIVALRHCQDESCIHALQSCLDDQRPVPFEAHGPLPRRVCDLAYDELFLKLRGDSRYALDPSPKMKGFISEKTLIKERDILIAKLKSKLSPVKVPSPAPSVPPEIAKPATASVNR
jgi:hypothetical protein